MSRWIGRKMLLGGLLLYASAQTAVAQGSFTLIDRIPGSTSSWARGVSPDGVHLTGECFGQGFYSEVMKWNPADGMLSLTPGRASGTNGAINWDGSAAAGYFPGNNTVLAFRWSQADGIEMLGDLSGGVERSTALAISTRGDIIVGGSVSDNGPEAIRWTAETGMVPLGDLPGGAFGSAALAISADGLVIAGAGKSEQGDEAMRWSEQSGMVGLGDLPGGRFGSVARAVSADGSVIIGTSFDASGQRAFIWTQQAGMVPLDDIAHVSQKAWGISWTGDVVVGQMEPRDGPVGAFYWTPTDGTRYLADVLTEHGVTVPEGWRLEDAYGVSADGRTIVGWASEQGLGGEGFVAHLGPACRADYNKDGAVTPHDVHAYLAAWAQRSIFADWDYDGLINTRDVIAFLNEWVAKPGC